MQEIIDEIEHLFDIKPDKRKKKEYNIWKTQINVLILQINSQFGVKRYNTVK